MTERRVLLAALALALAATSAFAEVSDTPPPPPPPPRPSEFAAPPTIGATPEPPARPADLDATPAEPTVAAPAPSPTPPPDDAACVALLASGDVRGERAGSAENACAIADGVTLRAIKLADGKEVSLGGGVTVRCAFAASVAQWVREDVAPRVAADGAALQALSGIGGLECRTRNHQPGARISEHARGAALDLRVLTTSAGPKDLTKADEATKALRADMKRTACARFTTVLGPGSDSFHADHIHMDMAERRNGYRMCQWDVE